MKYLIFSDSHGYVSHMEKIVLKEKPDKILFLGDVASDAADLRMSCFNYSICSVAGNNDFFSSEQREIILCDCGHKIFMTHGHLYHVKHSTDLLVNAAQKKGCDIALFGHTHKDLHETVDGVLLINPGSVTYNRSYAFMTIDENAVNAEIRSL